MDHRRSLILVTVDCLRADHVGFHGYERPTTPFLDSLSEESLVFENAIVGGAPTYYSFPTILASRPPLALGRDVLGVAAGESTLATVLKEAGYRTAAFLGGNPYLSPRFGYDEGFDVFVDSLDEAIKPESGEGEARQAHLRSRLNRGLQKACRRLGPLGGVYDELYFRYSQRRMPPVASLDSLRRFPAADRLIDQACSWLKGVKNAPFFLWLHLMDPHAPYYPVQKALEMMGTQDVDAARARYLNAYWMRDLPAQDMAGMRDEVVALYDAGIRWVDSQLRRLAEALHAGGLWKECAFAVTADHGEEFLEHGGRYHPPSTVTEELIHVPLLLRVPDGLRGRVTSTFSHLDLAPTLLDSLEAPVPEGFRGKSRWKMLSQQNRDWSEATIVECVSSCTNPFHRQNRLGPRIMAVRESRFKLVIDFRSSREWLFDLEADELELRPLAAGDERAVRCRLLERARQHLARSVHSRDLGQRLSAVLRDLRQDWPHSARGIPA